MNDEQQRFIDKARASLDERSQRLSPTLEGRLWAVRRTALSPGRHASPRFWMPAMAATAMVAVMAVMIWFSQPVEEEGITLARISANDGVADFEMLTQDAPLELYRDLEFYYWLEQGGEHAG